MESEPQPKPAIVREVLTIPKGLVKPMLSVQAELAENPIIKNRVGGGASKTYTYADLPTVLDAIGAACRKHKILLTQPPVMESGSELAIATVLAVVDGDQLCAVMRFPRGGDAQALGSAVTYLRRYSLLTIFGLAPEDDDDDGAAAKRAAKLGPKPDPGNVATDDEKAEPFPALIRRRLIEAWPSRADDLAGELLKAAAAALIGKPVGELTNDERIVWRKRISDATVERIIDRTAKVLHVEPAKSEAPTEKLKSEPPAPLHMTVEEFGKLIEARIVESDALAFQNVDKAHLIKLCAKELWGDDWDWKSWSKDTLATRAQKLGDAPIERLRAKWDPVITMPV